MDVGRLSRGQMIAAAGGLVLIISLFLSWAEGAFGGSASAWELFSGMDIILLIIALIAIAVGAVRAAEASVNLPGSSDLGAFVLGILALGWVFGFVLETSSAGIGAWLALLATVAIAYGTAEAVFGSLTPRPGAPTGAAGRRPADVTATPGAGNPPYSDPPGGSTPPPGV